MNSKVPQPLRLPILATVVLVMAAPVSRAFLPQIVEETKLGAATPGEYCGVSVAASGDTLLIGAYRDDALLESLRGPHAPARFRAIGPLLNMDAFYQAFDIQPTDAMYRPPEERVTVW